MSRNREEGLTMMCGVKYGEKKESLRISKEMHRKCLCNNDYFFSFILKP